MLNSKPLIGLSVFLIFNFGFTMDDDKSPITAWQEILSSNDSIENTWSKIKIDSVCSFYYPSYKMETPDELRKEINDSIYSFFNIQNFKKLVLQQKGSNQYSNLNYTRIIIELQKGEFIPRDTKTTIFTPEDIKMLNSNAKKNIETSLIKMKSKLVKWSKVEIKSINGNICMLQNYQRSSVLDADKSIIVSIYSFFDDNKLIELTMSTQTDTYLNWDSDFKRVLASFKLLN